MSGTIATVDERELVRRLHARAGRPSAAVVLGIGDDAALVEPVRGELLVLAADALVEDVHFRRRWTSAADLGRKALAVNLSDLASMGASPRACLLSLALPVDLPLADFDALIEGLAGLADTTGCPLVGGNLARSPGPLVVDVTVAGSVHRRRVLTRAGGRAGDDLYVTGSLGGARAGLLLLESGEADRGSAGPELQGAIARYERPAARLKTGRAVARQAAARAAIDLSDGLAAAVTQLAEASRTGAAIEQAELPVDPAAAAAAARMGLDPVELALAGGEDYEVLFAVPARRRRAFEAAVRRAGETTATRIGRLTEDKAVVTRTGDKLQDIVGAGFSHFGGARGA